MRSVFILLILLLVPYLFASLILECEEMVSEERDGCYLGKAKQPEQCNNIKSVYFRDQCFLAFAETHAQSYRECDVLYVQYHALCYARITYEGNDNATACGELEPDFKEECYVYYVTHKNPGQITACSSIPLNYQESCRKRLYETMAPKDERDCKSLFGERYYQECVDYLESKTNSISIALSFIASVWAFVSSPWTVAGTSIAIVLVILLLFYRICSRAAEKA
ncbi:MAG: hypothetical protein ABIG39_06200 [Candidatus Micrarchaeota archaeon]